MPWKGLYPRARIYYSCDWWWRKDSLQHSRQSPLTVMEISVNLHMWVNFNCDLLPGKIYPAHGQKLRIFVEIKCSNPAPISRAVLLVLAKVKKFYIKQTAQNYSVIYFQTTLASRSQTIAGEAILVTGIQREIESKSDLPTTWHSHFDQYG